MLFQPVIIFFHDRPAKLSQKTTICCLHRRPDSKTQRADRRCLLADGSSELTITPAISPETIGTCPTYGSFSPKSLLKASAPASHLLHPVFPSPFISKDLNTGFFHISRTFPKPSVTAIKILPGHLPASEV